MSSDDILAHVDHGEHFRDQRTRFFEVASFKRFTGTILLQARSGRLRTSSTTASSMCTEIDTGLVMKHASILPVSLIGRTVRVPVKQGICHHLANDGRLKWAP